jgi:aryl-alcohol dehydrogenase-like predicted oxidoreductase
MEKRRLGKTGLEVSILGFGASEIGERDASLSTVERLLGSALDAGLNVIDTAACYESSEELIGRAAGSRRSDYYILTKCGHASGLEFADWSPELIRHSIERSLKRLRTDYLDVLQLHSCGEEILRRSDVITALQKARDAGKVRYTGYSGDGAGALYAVTCGAFDTLQVSLSIADQEAIDLVLPAAIERDIGIIAKRPIANAAWLGRALIQSYARPYRQRLGKLRFDFLKHRANESVGKALRFTLSTAGVHTAIVGTSKPSRWEQNAELASKGPLAPAEYEAIRARWHEIAPSDWVGLQ